MRHNGLTPRAMQRPGPEDRAVLSARGWLSRCDTGFCTELFGNGHIRMFDAGETLYRHGDAAGALFGIIDGAVEIAVPADDGQEYIVNREERGFWIGDLAMLADQRRLVTVIASRPTRTLCVPAQRVQEMVERNPLSYRCFYALSHENMHTALRILANLAVGGARHRVALRLLHCGEKLAGPDGWIQMSQEELGALTAASPATLARELRKLVELDLIELGYGRLRLIDPEGLSRHCQS